MEYTPCTASINPIVLVVSPRPPVNLNGRTTFASLFGVLRKTGINWSNETL